MKNLTIVVVALIAVVLVVSTTWAWNQSHPPLALTDNSRKFYVNIVLGLDLTHSMIPADQEAAKRIICERIIPAVGPEDIFKVVEIGPQFSDASTIAGGSYGDQMPEIPDHATALVHQVVTQRSPEAPGIVSERILDLARQMEPIWPMVAKRREIWKEQVKAARPPQDLGSRFSKFFDGALAQLAAPRTGRIQVKRVNYVIVVGDLREEDQLGRPALIRPPTQLSPDVHVLLVYPNDSEHNWDAILARWRDYFNGAEVTAMPFGSAELQSTVLPPNPVAELEGIDTREFWDYAKLILPLNLWVVGSASLVILSGYKLFRKRTGASSVANV